MPTSTAISLMVIAFIAVLAPISAELLWRFRIPSILIEILLGILIGPSLLSWAHTDSVINGLSGIGLCFLFFLAGFEINFSQLKGAPIIRGGAGWLVSLILGLGLGGILLWSGYVLSSLLIGLALTTTAIGTLMPILKDREILHTKFGSFLTAAGAAGEFGPILAITILLGTESAGIQTLLLVGFIVIAVLIALIASRPQPPKVIDTLQKHLSTSTQLPVRIIILLIVAMVAIASKFGLELLLGAFVSGLIARLAIRPAQSELLVPKLEAVGFGFFIPIFFIVSGMKFDAQSLWKDPNTIIHALFFFGLFIIIRGAPALFLYRKILSVRERFALGFLQATALPMLVVIVEIGISTHHMKQINATALVAAGMLSVLVFPLIGFGILGKTSARDDDSTSRANKKLGLGQEMTFGDDLFPDTGV